MPDWVITTRESFAEVLQREVPRYRFPGGVLPSQVGNARTWLAMLEHLPHLQPGVIARYEYRYPYLDRDLVEFLFSIPREQLVRPGRRRSLMRRALTGIVPEKILERKRKAYCSRGPMVALARAIAAKRESGLRSMAVDLHLVDPGRLDRAFEDVVTGRGVDHIGALMRVLSFDSWMSGQIESGQVLLPT
jgi:asparagine synthase (glutamine-hydrolysing)